MRDVHDYGTKILMLLSIQSQTDTDSPNFSIRLRIL